MVPGNTSSSIALIITTTGNLDDAKRLARNLVEQQLAACVQFSPITSVYRWKNRIEEEEEVRLMIKAVEEKRSEVLGYLRQHHPYEVPEIITSTFSSDNAYHAWCLSVSGLPS